MISLLIDCICLMNCVFAGRDVLRWGKNLGSARTRTRRRAGVAVYNKASSLETLVSTSQ